MSRQEAQRLGRILRPKARSGSEFNAFFYTLISRDTDEMYYSSKRQQFLVDQGYAFHVVKDLPVDDSITSYASTQQQIELLHQVLCASAEDGMIEADEMDGAEGQAGNSSGVSGNGAAFSRKKGSMSEISGGKGLAYKEVSRMPQRAEQHALFKKREREKKQREKDQRDLKNQMDGI